MILFLFYNQIKFVKFVKSIDLKWAQASKASDDNILAPPEIQETARNVKDKQVLKLHDSFVQWKN